MSAESIPPEPPISSLYNWRDSNLRSHAKWEDEVKAAKDLGYQLVPPHYVVPHWTVALSGMPVPKLFAMKKDGIGEMTSAPDRPARDFGYPLYFKPSEACANRPSPAL